MKRKLNSLKRKLVVFKRVLFICVVLFALNSPHLYIKYEKRIKRQLVQYKKNLMYIYLIKKGVPDWLAIWVK